MAKVKITTRFDIIEDAKDFLDPGFTGRMGTEIVSQMKAMIAQGISPVRGYRRFEAYAAQRGAKEDKRRNYPNSIQWKYPGKSQRPVNLSLSGDMLAELTFKKVNAETITVGMIDASDDNAIKAKAHNQGVPEKNIPQRRFIPQGDEEFAQTIMRAIIALYSRRWLDIIRRSNR